MTSEGNLSGIDLIRKGFAQVIACLILFCLCFLCYPAFASQNIKSSNLVFCPIQRDWVEKYTPRTKTKEPLEDICAGRKVKSLFFFEVSKNYPLFRFISSSDSIEKFFFTYLKKEKKVLTEIQPFQNVPSPQSFIIAKTDESIANFKKNFTRNSTESFVLAQAARPPNNFIITADSTKLPRKLTDISRRIKPRAPPVLI